MLKEIWVYSQSAGDFLLNRMASPPEPPGLSKASENGADFTGEMLLNKNLGRFPHNGGPAFSGRFQNSKQYTPKV